MTNGSFFIGLPVNFNDICYIYPPKIQDMVKEDFYQNIGPLLVSQENIEDELRRNDIPLDDMPTPLEQLLNLAYNQPEIKLLIEKGFYQMTHEEVTFIYKIKKIAFGNKKEILEKIQKIEDIRFITEENYFDFQNLVRQAVGQKPIEPYKKDEDPRVKKIKAAARYRDEIKAKKGMGISLVDTISSICCMGIGLNPLNIGELTYVAAQELIARYSEKEKFDIDLHTIWAGADQKKHKLTPKHWIRKLEEK